MYALNVCLICRLLRIEQKLDRLLVLLDSSQVPGPVSQREEEEEEEEEEEPYQAYAGPRDDECERKA